jgi:hypothetical protein
MYVQPEFPVSRRQLTTLTSTDALSERHWFLGRLTYLEAKAEGNKSMSGKR